MSFALFIDDVEETKIEPLKESTERYTLNCAKKALGPDAFRKYFAQFGHSGLEKTLELCVRDEIGSNENCIKLMDEFGRKDRLDFGFDRGKLRYGIQLKTSEKYKKWISLSRIDEIQEDEDIDEDNQSSIGSNAYISILEKECIKKSIDVCLLLYICPTVGTMYLRKFCHMEDGKLVMASCDNSSYRYPKKGTSLNINQEDFPLMGKANFDPLVYIPPVFPTVLRSTTIEEYKKMSNEALEAFQIFNTYSLGFNWGDKGLAWEKFFVDWLKSQGIDAKQLKKNDICDSYVKGIGLIQMKHYDSNHTKTSLQQYCRASSGPSPTWRVCPFFGTKIMIPVDKSEDRKVTVEGRLKECIINNGGGYTKIYIHCASSYNMKNDLYFATELQTDGSLSHKGSFLKDRNYFSSTGGKNGNQTHFTIKYEDLIEV